MFNPKDAVPDEEWGATFPRQKGTAIWQFAGNATKGVLMAAMQEQGVRVLMEADDNYIVGADMMGPDWRQLIDPNVDYHSYEAHCKLVNFCDGVIVSTPNLAEWYGHLNKNVYVCPNSVDPDDWPEPEKKDDGILRIGWAASHSHIVDAPLVRRALHWASLQDKVEVWVYGIGDIVKFPGAVKRVKWTDNLADYRRSLSLCDVHICPLTETPWSAGKSDIKALEAAMAGAWPIVSSATPYEPWHERTIKCGSPKEWQDALKWAVRHRDEIPALAAEAKRYVLEERLIEQSIHTWREAISG